LNWAAHGYAKLIAVERRSGSIDERRGHVRLAPPERLFETPSAIQVITQNDIRRSGATSLPEALRLASNLQVAQVDARQWAISARGLNGTTANKAAGPHRRTDRLHAAFSGVFWERAGCAALGYRPDRGDQRPGATLWGSNAVNGVIKSSQGRERYRGLLVTGGGGSELGGGRQFGSARYGGKSGRTRIIGSTARASVAIPRLLPNGQGAAMTGTWDRADFDWTGRIGRPPSQSAERLV